MIITKCIGKNKNLQNNKRNQYNNYSSILDTAIDAYKKISTVTAPKSNQNVSF